jgi:hypothetical protein
MPFKSCFKGLTDTHLQNRAFDSMYVRIAPSSCYKNEDALDNPWQFFTVASRGLASTTAMQFKSCCKGLTAFDSMYVRIAPSSCYKNEDALDNPWQFFTVAARGLASTYYCHVILRVVLWV